MLCTHTKCEYVHICSGKDIAWVSHFLKRIMNSIGGLLFLRCVLLDAKEAEDKHILAVHSQNHVNLIKKISSKQFDSRRNRIASKLNSIYFNEGSSEAAYLAAGSAIEVIIVGIFFHS